MPPPWMPSLPRPSVPGWDAAAYWRAADYAARRGTVDIALALLVSDAGLRRSEAAELKWGEVARWPDGSGRTTVRRSKTDATGPGAVVYATMKSSAPRTMAALDAIRPDDGDGEGLVFGGLALPRSPGTSRRRPPTPVCRATTPAALRITKDRVAEQQTHMVQR